MTSPDVTVRGAGAFGLSVAWACAARGARVRVVDPQGVGAGASGGVVGALAPHAPEHWTEAKAFQLDSLLMADAWWAAVAAAGGRSPGYGRTGRLQPIADDAALERARARAENAAGLWRGQAEWRIVDRTDIGDFAPDSPSDMWIFDTLSARLSPLAACRALAAAITARGGEVVAEAPDAGAVVWATGWQGLVAMSAGRDRRVGTGIKGQAALLALAARDAPQLYAPGLHVVPHADGTVAVGSTTERDVDAPAATDDQLDAVIARARALCPALRDAPVTRRWAGVRPRSRTRAPMLVAHPLRPGQFVANGGFKIGFGVAPLAGEAMADLVLEGDGRRIPDSFDPAASL